MGPTLVACVSAKPGVGSRGCCFERHSQYLPVQVEFDGLTSELEHAFPSDSAMHSTSSSSLTRICAAILVCLSARRGAGIRECCFECSQHLLMLGQYEFSDVQVS